MSLLHIAVMAPFIVALLIMLTYKLIGRVHTGWVILPVPVVLFAYFVGLLPAVQRGEEVRAVLEWIPSAGIHFTVLLDGLSLIFALLISGIGSLVVLYSIFYMDKNKEAVHRFYVWRASRSPRNTRLQVWICSMSAQVVKVLLLRQEARARMRPIKFHLQDR